MKTANIKVWRGGEGGADGHYQEYQVPWEEGETVLGALQHVYEQQDASLALRYGCRYKVCGLCGMRIAGEDRLACTVHLKDGMEIEPMQHLPLIRDLVIDRRPQMEELKSLSLRADPDQETDMVAWKQTEAAGHYYNCFDCVECLCCHSMCEKADNGHSGAFTLVKLAQMHHHPRNAHDRVGQARDAGLEDCVDCRKCHCPYGVKIQQNVIGEFLRAAGME
ncbi:MAG: 2Fe-2S iron-sulfur cluster-binding protein [Rhodospirillales bacterium]|nr:2Fe-2S iron-sulfur cluster-binding protein [Rhodospirillales bacterium]